MNPLNQKLIELIYDAASIRRWNDQVNPMDFTELDKQAHKMIIAYVLAKVEEDIAPGSVDWLKLIEGGIFEMLHRIILNDIKPPVFHKMIRRKDVTNEWVFRRLEGNSSVKGRFASACISNFFSAEICSGKNAF